MRAELRISQPSRRRRLTGVTLSGLAVLFMLFDGGFKLLQAQPVREGMAALGYPEHLAPYLGLVEVVCVVLYLVPRTSVLGVVLLTGYLGGATASHVRQLAPLLTHILFPSYIAALLWGGLYLRDTRLVVLNPLAR